MVPTLNFCFCCLCCWYMHESIAIASVMNLFPYVFFYEFHAFRFYACDFHPFGGFSICGVRQGTTFILSNAATAAAKSLQLCLTLCDPRDGSPPGSPVPGILQARTLEWVAISFSNAWKRKVKVKSLSCVWLLATPWTAAYQAPPSMGFSRQEYWSGVPLPSPNIV